CLRLDPFSDKEEQRRVTQVLRRSFQHARDQQHPEVTVDAGYSSYIDAWLSQEEPDATVATDWVDVAVWWQGFTLELQRIKEEVLIPKLEELRETEHGLLGTPVDPAAGSEYASELKRFRDALDKTDVPWSELRGILSLTNGERRKKADEICKNKKKKFDDVAKH